MVNGQHRRLVCAEVQAKSGRGQPHSKTLRTFCRAGLYRDSVLECGCSETVSKRFGSAWQLRANFGVEGLDEAVGFSRSGCWCSRREMVHKFVNSNGALVDSIACEELAS